VPGTNIDPEQPIAWRVVPQDVEVRSSDGVSVGTLEDLLGSDEEDIFHGLIVKTADGNRTVFIPSENVTLLTGSHVDLSFSADEVRALPDHSAEKTFHLGWKGIFNKTVGWIEEKDR
jgi:hypothetical protein